MDLKLCGFCGEEKDIVAKGLCNACYQRWWKRGSLEYIKVRKPCTAEGCSELSQAHGLCWKHLKRFQRYGHIKPTRPRGWGSAREHPLYELWRWRSRRNDFCDEWKEFWQFANDVGDHLGKDYMMVKIDKAKPYSKENYEWRKKESHRGKEENRLYQIKYRNSIHGKRKIKDRILQKRYNVTLEQYDALYDQQQGKCAICGKIEESKRYNFLVVDHCHHTQKVRGLLCNLCNRALGLFGDDVETIRKAVKYMDGFS